MNEDLPSPIDLRLMPDAVEWSRTAEQRRPQRPQIFDAMAQQIAGTPGVDRVLELGSGPGFLARHLLSKFPAIEYVALDFSAAMHALANERLGDMAKRVTFVERSFLDADWPDDLGEFQCVVTLQSVHELRHKSRAPLLHEQARSILSDCGMYLFCDHFTGDGGMSNSQLFMTVDEQESALRRTGFSQVERLLVLGSLALFSAK